VNRGQRPPAPAEAWVDPALGMTVPYRVRFDESSPAGTIRTSALLRYAQDVAWLHSERLGFDRAWYAERGLTWLVRSVELVVEGCIETGAALP
jgi:acyl-ACP thioesterase